MRPDDMGVWMGAAALTDLTLVALASKISLALPRLVIDGDVR